MFQNNFKAIQLKIIKFVKKYFLQNSPYLKKNYFAFYENGPGIIKVKKNILNERNYKIILLNLIESLQEKNFKIDFNNNNNKNFRNLIITWGDKSSFSSNGIYTDKYFSYNSNTLNDTYWIILSPDKISRKYLSNNISVIYLNKRKINNSLVFLKIFYNFFLKIFYIKNLDDQDSIISNVINNHIKSNINLKNLKNLLMPYEGQAFQKIIFKTQKKRNSKINTYGFDHSAPHSLATQLIYTKGSPDILIVSGKNTKQVYSKFYGWPKKKIIISFPNRYKLFKYTNFVNKMFLPYDFERSEVIKNSFENFLIQNKYFDLNKLKILVHPQKKNTFKHVSLKNDLNEILSRYNLKKKKNFKKKITIVIGFTSAALVALEFKNTVLHICPNPEIDCYLNSFWKGIIIKKIDNFTYLYDLKTKGRYLNFKQSDKIKKLLNEKIY